MLPMFNCGNGMNTD